MANRLKVMSVALWCALIILGLFVSLRKPLWIDEVYSTLYSIEQPSYVSIVTGKIESTDGNHNPLFSLAQKAVIDLAHYRSPSDWSYGGQVGGHNDPYSNVLLRILPVTCMSASIVLIFYFFSRFYSIWLGVYSLAVAFSSFMVWAYGFEARPYALWFFLTTLQALCFLRCLDDLKSYQSLSKFLILVHLSLALTIVFSVIQISAVCILLWFLGDRDWRKYIGLWLIPMIIVLFYRTHVPALKFYFVEGFMGLIGASIPRDRLFILGVFMLFWGFVWGWKRGMWPAPRGLQGLSPQVMRMTGAYGILTGLVLAGFLAVLVLLKLQESAIREGFRVPNRYFISLAPLGIIATTLFSYYMVAAQKGTLRVFIFICLSGLLFFRIFQTAALVHSLHMY